MNRKLAIVGDIHACSRELNRLIEKVREAHGDVTFVFLGDLLDKGYDNLGTLKTLMELKSQDRFFGVMGNHDWRFWKTNYNQRYLNRSKDKNYLTDDFFRFLDELDLYLKIGNFTFVHGGIYPNILRKYSKLPKVPADWKIISKKENKKDRKLRYRLHRLMFVYKIDSEGYKTRSYNDPGELWAKSYDGSEGFVFYGHSTFPKPRWDNHALGLDTGCVYGKELTAYIVEENADPRSGTFLSVKSDKEYYKPSFDFWS